MLALTTNPYLSPFTFPHSDPFSFTSPFGLTAFLNSSTRQRPKVEDFAPRAFNVRGHHCSTTAVTPSSIALGIHRFLLLPRGIRWGDSTFRVQETRFGIVQCKDTSTPKDVNDNRFSSAVKETGGDLHLASQWPFSGSLRQSSHHSKVVRENLYWHS